MRAFAPSLVAVVMLVSACGGAGGSRELVVSAASSLTDAFEQLAEDFEADNPGVDVLLNFDSSATLANQIDKGAPVDVFASADRKNAEQAVAQGRVAGDAVGFATNELVIVTRPGNDMGVREPADLAGVVEAGEVVALCAESAPCGQLADELLAGDGKDPVQLSESGVTRAPNARATLRAVTRGDAAAALVYRSDALAAGDAVELVEAPAAQRVSTEYLIVAIADGPGDPDLATGFVELVLSQQGRAVLSQEGFG